ncbi:alpha-1,2-mannosyltransferase ALG9-like [Pecten maximus]|uniref:alpha-1,2-mannosyltransferase ALG9-like n=1 Tax=Pecten maximus TaxID=6579 RepID=UPI00145909A1|nr:alpha-1,2-mannosyltransferase ALG9-like [Pecten maximus]
MSASTKQRRKNSKTDKGALDINRSSVEVPPGGTSPPEHQPWTPSAYTAFKIVLSARLCAAVWNIVGDCDETFNYWEPVHYLIYGSGFQTWEYSPVYAIRSYAYLWIHALPIRIYNSLFQANKILLFYLLRCILALCCAGCEIYFYRGVCKHFGANTGRILLFLLLLNTGMFISSSAFLPSSFCMYMTFVSMGGWFLRQYSVAILGTAASAILGWPFAGILGLPIAIDVLLRRRKLKEFVLWSVVGLAVFLLPMIRIDYQHYLKLVIAPLNIVMYNVFTSHGPDLYGVEPFSYYFLNGFLNFNIVFVLALLCLPITVFVKCLLKLKNTDIPVWLAILPMYIWILVFFTRPHKEERFLFPIYPFFVLCGSLSIDYIQKFWCYLFTSQTSRHYTEHTNWISQVSALIFSLVSISRIFAVYQGYHAPLDLYVGLNKIAADPKIHTLSTDKPVNICVGKEWYRFPSSFFLPGENWKLKFIESDFKGQLPQPFQTGPDATSVIPSHMNDMNREEKSRYVDISKCHYLIDLDLDQESPLEPRYSQKKDEWKILLSVEFLDASRSHRFFRAFYIPFISNKYCSYVNYNILKTTRTKRGSRQKTDIS